MLIGDIGTSCGFQTFYDEKCEIQYETVYKDECKTVYEPKCETKYETVQATFLPRKSKAQMFFIFVFQEPKCETKYDTKCETKYETEYEEECRTEYRTETKTEYDTKCETSYEQKCEIQYETVFEQVFARVCCDLHGVSGVRPGRPPHHHTQGRLRRPPGRYASQHRTALPDCVQAPVVDSYGSPAADPVEIDSYGPPQSPVCRQVPKQQEKEECTQVPRENCIQVPREVEVQVPEEVCEQVPKQVAKNICRQEERQEGVNIPRQVTQ